MSEEFEVSIVMPCLNEAETLRTCIQKAQMWAKNSGTKVEVIVADNGSTDGSREIATSAGARVVDVPIRGYGAALYAGAKAAKANLIIMGDSDDSYDFSKLDPFFAGLLDGSELVIGNRFAGGIAPGAMPWKNKYIGNPVLSLIGRVLFNIPVRDFHCGIRGFTKTSFERMDLRTTGMEFASEMVIKAKILGMKIIEVPTTLSRDGRSRPPHLKPWRDGWRHLRFMITLSASRILFTPGVLCISVLLIPFITFLFGPITLGAIVFSYNSFVLVQALMYLAILATLIGLTLKSIAVREGLGVNDKAMNYVKNTNYMDAIGLAGAILFVTGLVLATLQFAKWAAIGFSTLGKWADFLQLNVALDFLVLGATGTFFSFVFAFLNLHTRTAAKKD